VIIEHSCFPEAPEAMAVVRVGRTLRDGQDCVVDGRPCGTDDVSGLNKRPFNPHT
jgi:hypothetical protein